MVFRDLEGNEIEPTDRMRPDGTFKKPKIDRQAQEARHYKRVQDEANEPVRRSETGKSVESMASAKKDPSRWNRRPDLS